MRTIPDRLLRASASGRCDGPSDRPGHRSQGWPARARLRAAQEEETWVTDGKISTHAPARSPGSEPSEERQPPRGSPIEPC